MEEIITTIFDSSVWVTAVIGVLVAKLLSYLTKPLKGFAKKTKLNYLKKIRRVRRNQAEVIYEIGKANSYFIFFLLVCLMYLFFLVIGPLGEVAETNKLALAIIVSPMYLVQMIWMMKDGYAKDLVKASRFIKVR